MNPQRLTEIGEEAYKYIKENLTWEHSKFDLLLNALKPKLKVLFIVMIVLSIIGGFGLSIYVDSPEVMFGGSVLPYCSLFILGHFCFH